MPCPNRVQNLNASPGFLPLASHPYKSSSSIKSSLSSAVNDSSTPFMSPPLIHHFRHSMASTVSEPRRFLKSVMVKLHLQLVSFLIGTYPLNTLSGSTDIEGIQKTLKAIRASVGYSIALPFHHSKALNALFAAADSKTKIEASKYRVSSSVICCIFPNRHLFKSNGLSSSSSSSSIVFEIQSGVSAVRSFTRY